jgi:uncharacterized protein
VEQRISLVTLGVVDLARARAFYEALGWRGQEVEETVFFQAGCLAVVLWGRVHLAADCGVEDHAEGGFGGVALAHNVRSRAEVDAVLAEVEAAGGTITAGARDVLRRLRRRGGRPGRPPVGDRPQPGLRARRGRRARPAVVDVSRRSAGPRAALGPSPPWRREIDTRTGWCVGRRVSISASAQVPAAAASPTCRSPRISCVDLSGEGASGWAASRRAAQVQGMGRRDCAVGPPGCWGTTASRGAMAASASRLVRSARPGSAG